MKKRQYEIKPDIRKQIAVTLIRDEMGGILGSAEDGTVTHYHFDVSGRITETNAYVPDVRALNQVLIKWHKEGIRFAGFVHSHVYPARNLSPADIEYARKIVETCGLDHILMLLYLPKTDELIEYIIKSKSQ